MSRIVDYKINRIDAILPWQYAQRSGRVDCRTLPTQLSGRYSLSTFCKNKEFKRIAMHRDNTDESFKAMIWAAAAIIDGA